MLSLFRIGSFAALALSVSVSVSAWAGPVVKQSSSGLCHSQESSYYSRTKNFTAFDSLQACVDAGGRLPKGITLASSSGYGQSQPANDSAYSRDHFGSGWATENCRDTRSEILASQATGPVRYADPDKRCRVVSGRWISPYTGSVLSSASNIDVDHVYPLAHAWERGADQWTDSKRLKFANDPVNLLVSEAALNRSKGAKPPTEWLPPKGQCGYVARFVRVGMTYGLTPTQHEKKVYRRMLDNCKRTGRVGG